MDNKIFTSPAMNGSLMAMGVIAAVSIVLFSVIVYRFSSLANYGTSSDSVLATNNGSLEEDIRDIVKLLSLPEIQLIINDYLRYDPQIDSTVSFIEDQKKFLAREFQRIPELIGLANFLRKNGLELDNWYAKIRDFWKARTAFVKPDPSIATGGLTVMIQNILNTVPKNELHKLLQRKAKYSGSFRRLREMLKSKDFTDLCDSVDKNIVLQHHIFWAKQEGIEITFALELLRNLYIYVTEEI